MINKLNELDKKIYRYILLKGSKGALQSILCRELGITSREASKSIKKLETFKLIKREPVSYSGKRTYRIVATKKKINELVEEKTRVVKPTLSISDFLDIPCMSCPYIMSICYEGGYYDPRSCIWLREWVKSSTGREKNR